MLEFGLARLWRLLLHILLQPLLHLLLLLIVHTERCGLAVLSGVLILAFFVGTFILLYVEAVSVCIRVLADTRHLPGNVHVGFVGLDGDVVVLDLA
jgi:hypothetical protein